MYIYIYTHHLSYHHFDRWDSSHPQMVGLLFGCPHYLRRFDSGICNDMPKFWIVAPGPRVNHGGLSTSMLALDEGISLFQNISTNFETAQLRLGRRWLTSWAAKRFSFCGFFTKRSLQSSHPPKDRKLNPHWKSEDTFFYFFGKTMCMYMWLQSPLLRVFLYGSTRPLSVDGKGWVKYVI